MMLGAPRAGRVGTRARYELAGPETLSHSEIVRIVLASLHRRRPLVHVPTPVVARGLRLVEAAGSGRIRDLGRGRAARGLDGQRPRQRRCPRPGRHAALDVERLGRGLSPSARRSRNGSTDADREDAPERVERAGRRAARGRSIEES